MPPEFQRDAAKFIIHSQILRTRRRGRLKALLFDKSMSPRNTI